jgi:hypothetical protein
MLIPSREYRRGIAVPIVVCTIALLFIVFFTLFMMMRGVGGQLEYSDAHIRAVNIAESGYQQLVARLMSQPWEDRWFLGGPDAKAGVSYGGGTFDYFIQTTAGAERSADLWVRGTYKNTRRLLFYRLRYRDLLFKSLSQPAPDFAGSSEMAPALSPGAINELTTLMNEHISRRERNRVEATRKWQEISQKMDPIEILRMLGAHLDGSFPNKSKSPKDGVPTDVPPPPPTRPPAGTKPFIEKIEKTETLAAWFSASVLLDTGFIKDKIIPVIEEINKTIEACFKGEKYQQAEQIYREFLDFVFTVRVGVNLGELEARLKLYSELAKIAKDYKGKEFDQRAAEIRAKLAAKL